MGRHPAVSPRSRTEAALDTESSGQQLSLEIRLPDRERVHEELDRDNKEHPSVKKKHKKLEFSEFRSAEEARVHDGDK